MDWVTDKNDTMKTTSRWETNYGLAWLETLQSKSEHLWNYDIQFPGMTRLVDWREMSVKMKTSLGKVKQNMDLIKAWSWWLGGKTRYGMGAESECARGKSSIDTPGKFSPLCQFRSRPRHYHGHHQPVPSPSSSNHSLTIVVGALEWWSHFHCVCSAHTFCKNANDRQHALDHCLDLIFWFQSF